MDPFYPLLYNNRGFTTPSCLEDSSSSDFRSDYSFNYNYATGYNLAPSQNPASWMQLDSAFSVSSHTTSRFKSSSSPMSLTPVPSVTDIMTQVSPIPCKLDAIDELPPRSKDAKRSRPPPETTENTSWSDDQESVTNDLKKIRLPTVETRSLYVKNLSGTKLFLECDPDALVLHLKHQIEAMNGVPAHEQRLLYCGVALNDYKSIAEYGIQDKATIHMVVSLRGG